VDCCAQIAYKQGNKDISFQVLILSHLDDFAQEQVAEKAEDNREKMANAFEYSHVSEPVHL